MSKQVSKAEKERFDMMQLLKQKSVKDGEALCKMRIHEWISSCTFLVIGEIWTNTDEKECTMLYGSEYNPLKSRARPIEPCNTCQ